MANNKTRNVLIIGDLHEPFCIDGYLEFCKSLQKQYKTNHTIFIGDIIDNHYSSYHDTDPDGYGAGEELRRAVDKLVKWHKAFPNADVVIGNHDRLVARKAFSAGISSGWIRDFKDVLKTPTWTYRDEFEYDDVLYIHGEGVTARTKANRSGQSTVQGHRHCESYVWFNPERRYRNFGMQVGCGVDNKTYAMAYAKHHPAPAISAGVVLDDGKMAIVIPYERNT